MEEKKSLEQLAKEINKTYGQLHAHLKYIIHNQNRIDNYNRAEYHQKIEQQRLKVIGIITRNYNEEKT